MTRSRRRGARTGQHAARGRRLPRHCGAPRRREAGGHEARCRRIRDRGPVHQRVRPDSSSCRVGARPLAVPSPRARRPLLPWGGERPLCARAGPPRCCSPASSRTALRHLRGQWPVSPAATTARQRSSRHLVGLIESVLDAVLDPTATASRAASSAGPANRGRACRRCRARRHPSPRCAQRPRPPRGAVVEGTGLEALRMHPQRRVALCPTHDHPALVQADHQQEVGRSPSASIVGRE